MMAETEPLGSPDAGDLPFLLDGVFVAERFGLPVARMRELMDRRMVQSRVEKGEGEDAGHWRLTLRLGNRVWRGVFTADGQLCNETRGLAGRMKTQADRRAQKRR